MRYPRRFGLLAILSAILLVPAAERGPVSARLRAVVVADQPAAPISVRIVPTSVSEKRGRAISLYRPSDHFYVIVTNTSDKPVRLWAESCSWGYRNLSFAVTDETGTTTTVAKIPIDWTVNPPVWSIVTPGDHMVFEVAFDQATWRGVPLPMSRGSRVVKMKAVYSVATDEYSKRYGIWSGQISSPKESFTLYR
jgi:hypothetical protein